MPDVFSLSFLASVLQIIAIDILLGGDNAVVIALACRKLPAEQRRQGIFWGVAGAIALRIVLIFFALRLLALPYLKIVGGVLLLWIGVKLLQPEEEGHDDVPSSTTLWGAIRTVIIADAVMSVDNVIAVAGAANGNLLLVVFGILISIPLVVWGSQLVLRLMDRFPVVITAGGALLGWIGGGMIVSDPAMPPALTASLPQAHHLAGAAGAIGVVAAGMWCAARARRRPPPAIALSDTTETPP